jgi:LacI family transcriptional regulator
VNPSQKDIARELNLSIATVSRSLRNHKGINPRTRARVLQAATEMGYRLNSICTISGVQEPVTQVGVLLCDVPARRNDSLPNERMLTGVAEEARRHDISLHVERVQPSRQISAAKKSDSPSFQSWRGTLLLGVEEHQLPARLIREHTFVQVANYAPGMTCDCIDHDDGASCDALVGHLWKRGVRRIGFVVGDLAAAHGSNRYSGVCGALARRRHLLIPQDIVQLKLPGRPDRPLHHIRSRIRSGTEGWICADDGIGYAWLRYLREHGINCPADVAVCGFDNYKPPKGLPKLTTIDAPFEEMGALAIKRLLERLGRDTLETVHTMLKCRLRIGRSTRK